MTSLSDLKEEAEAQDAELLAQQQAAESEEIEQEDLEEDQPIEEESDTGTDDEKPEWAKTDKQVPLAAHVDMKHKLKARAAAAETNAASVAQELERVRQELEQLKSGSQQPSTDLKPPTLAECEYDEEVFAQRQAKYVDQLIEAKLYRHANQSQAQTQELAAKQTLANEVDKHYERAGKLVADGMVTPENFQAAETVVRNRIAASFPHFNADDVVDTLIANMGQGSEKVIFHLGVNPSALAELESSLRANPSGLRAATYLGELKTRFESASTIKPSSAHRPDKPLRGDASIAKQNYLKQYQAAHTSGDVSKMLAAKRAAKAAGQDVSKW